MDALTLTPVITSLTVGVALLILFFWYSTRHHQYWKKRNIPFVKPKLLFGSLLETFSQSLHIAELERYKKYGTVYGHFEGSSPVISIADPSLLRKILIKDFHSFSCRRTFTTGEPVLDQNVGAVKGEDWKRIRSIITPTFTTGKIKKMLSIFKDCSQVCAKNFSKEESLNQPINFKKIYEAFSMDVIASSAFSTKLDSHSDPNNEFVSTARQLFRKVFSWRFMISLMFPKLVKFLGISAAPLNEIYFFKNIILQIIEQRKRTGQVRNDFLQLLLETANEESLQESEQQQEADDILTNYGKEDSREKVLKTINKNKLSNIELVAQCMVFFLAGFESTSSTLSFASYLLALNTEIQEKTIAEIDAALASSDGQLTYESLQNMKYLDNVISETLRMYPPGVRTDRVADEDYNLGYRGIVIPKGMIVTIPVIAIQNDPIHYPEPETFNPDRFCSEERAKRDQLVYMPFGVGPRNCIGMRFALVEIKVCLAILLSQFRFKICQQTKVPIEFLPGPILLQPKEILLRVETRKDNATIRYKD